MRKPLSSGLSPRGERAPGASEHPRIIWLELVSTMMWSDALMHEVLAGEGSMACAQAEQQPLMDESEFNAFYQKTARPLWHYIYRVGGDSSLVDDILQETYIRFLHARALKQDELLMKAYLYKIATHLI